MDTHQYSIYKTVENRFFLEVPSDKRVYGFPNFSSLIAAFPYPKGPQFEGCEPGAIPQNYTKIDIFEHVYTKILAPNAQPLPYYYWLKSGKRVDTQSYILVESLLESIQEIERW